MKTALKSVEPKIDAVEKAENFCKAFHTSEKINTRKNIDPQRKFVIKKRRPNKKLAVKPQKNEAHNIVMSALMSNQPSTSHAN